MTLGSLLEILRHESLLASNEQMDTHVLDVDVAAITEDSRKVGAGFVFAATQGVAVNGHDFAAQARERGAVAVLGDRENTSHLDGLPYLHVTHTRKALGIVAHALHGEPTHSMIVIGVTGTNGKSSTVSLLHQLLESFGYRPAAFGTLGYQIGKQIHPASHTTPFGEELAQLFADAREADCTHAVMEVSSHALEQERVAGINFNVGVFTNLSQDHLDYHDTMHAYRDEKLKLFQRLSGPNSFAVVNSDDSFGEDFAKESPSTCYRFGAEGDCRAENMRYEDGITTFDLSSPWGDAVVRTSLLGAHSVMNLLAAITTCGGLGLPIDWIADHVPHLLPVPGRFERIEEGQDFDVIVDYAHTEDGLLNVLRSARAICTGRLITVFGCGGDRDRAKRPKMASAVAKLGDFGIITSDNPRTEDIRQILDETEAGMKQEDRHEGEDYLVIADRGQAIASALEMARPGDLVLLAGKGHEDYQVIGTERIHFDDREVARSILARSREKLGHGSA